MKKTDKVLLLFILLAGLAVSVCMLSLFYPVPYLQGIIADYQAGFPWIQYVFAGYSAFISLCLFVLMLVVLFFPNKLNFLTIPKTKGKIEFSKKTVESAIRYGFADTDGINHSRIKLKIGKKPDKTKVYIKLSLNDATKLASLTETVQEKVAASLQTSLGITVKTISVSVTEYKQDTKDGGDAVKDSAVV